MRLSLAAALKPEAIGLFLDVDGTLLDLAPRPDAVEVSAVLLDALSLAERRLDGALALVSGRPIDDLDRLFAPLRLRASGIHGAEIRYSPSGAIQSLTHGRLPEKAWFDLMRLLGKFPGTFAENKGVSFAVHHRTAGASADELAAALRRFIEQFGGLELELTTGHLVFEIKGCEFDKGKAIARFMTQEPFAGRYPVFIADDRMDRAGFDTALALGGMAFSVGDALPGLSGWFSAPERVRAWLATLGR